MGATLANYKATMEHEHGWETELHCSECGWKGIPKYNGWTPSNEMHFGVAPTIYANLNCPECSSNLKKEAGEKLIYCLKHLKITFKFKL